MKYIVLLRGVMPTGKNKLKMADLREKLTRAGYEDVQSYIQSGNVLLISEKKPAEISVHIHEVIKSELGPDLAIVVKTIDEFKKILSGNPYQADTHNNSVTFCAMAQTLIDTGLQKEIDALNIKEEYVTVTPQCIYYYLPGGAHRAKINNNRLERKSKLSLTSRNQNTMEKLLVKAEEMDDFYRPLLIISSYSSF